MELQPFAPGEEKKDTRVYVEITQGVIHVGKIPVGVGQKHTHAWLPKPLAKRLSLQRRARTAQPPRPAPVEDAQEANTSEDASDE